MKKITGRWTGEYSINYGTEDEPEMAYFHFKSKISENDDGIKGNFIDLTLKTSDSSIHGFVDEDFISFIRTSDQSPELLEFLHLDNTDRPFEFEFSGNYSEEENAYQGIWEIVVDEKQEGIQESYLTETRTGAWYMRKE